jgi:hypothetical protein
MQETCGARQRAAHLHCGVGRTKSPPTLYTFCWLTRQVRKGQQKTTTQYASHTTAPPPLSHCGKQKKETMKMAPSLSSVLVAVFAALVLLLSCSPHSANALKPTFNSATLSSKNNPRGFAMDIDDASNGGCRAHTSAAACAKPCEWCVSAAVPASCYASKAAGRVGTFHDYSSQVKTPKLIRPVWSRN